MGVRREIAPYTETAEVVSPIASEPAHRWEFIDGVLVWSTTPGPIRDDVWQAFLDEVSRLRPRQCVGLCAGAINIDVVQRRRLTEALVRSDTSVLLLADDRVTVRLVGAVGWFGARLDARPWRELVPALAGLALPDPTRFRVLEAARAFHARHAHLDR